MSANAVRRGLFIAACSLASVTAAAQVTITPSATQTINENASIQFTASAAATWMASCGHITSGGLYTAGLYPTTCTITATSTSDGSTATVSATVVSPITMSPVTPSTPQGQTQQFTSSAPVIWTVGCGSITAGGMYTASAPVGKYCTVEGTAASGTQYHVYGYDHIAAPSTPLTISPASAALGEGGTQQFTASASANWSASCGSVSTTGLYTAPLASGTCTVTAAPTAGGSAASAAVTVSSPITITPSSTTTSQYSTQQFTASAAVTWAASCGSISSGGLFTASGTQGSVCSITATAASGTAYTASATDTIGANTFTISPSTTQTVNENATFQFTASASATWSASCGKVNSSGLFTAGLYPATCTVTATSAANGSTASASVTVVSPITMSPVTPSTPQGQTQQFTSSAPVIWTVGCGSITAGGLYTASAQVGKYCTVEGTAASGTQYHVYGYDRTLAPLFAVSPTSATVSEGATQQFTANAGATWTASCGSITTAGLYMAPLVVESCTVTATPTAGGSAVSGTVSVVSPITIMPSSATTSQYSTQQFTASAPVTWAASCGSISSAGLFTASATQGSVCSITATAASGTAYTAPASDTIGAPNVFTISPSAASVSEAATQQFTASQSATWSASCGTIDNTGLFTAPLTTGSCTVTGTPTGGGSALSAAVTVTSPITITPAAVNLHAMNMQTFTASQPVTWTASCGSISNGGVFTAPPVAGSCTLTATASGGTAFTAVATANMDVVNYTAWKGGGGINGAQTDELALTPANVNSSLFGLKWTASVDGLISVQPLYMNAVTINGVAHNMVFVATENDSVYAFDGDSGALLWQVSLIPSGATAVAAASIGYTSAQQVFGIMGTPVIDPTTNTMYVVAETSEQNATYFPHRLHALDVTTGAEKFGGPVLISNPQMQLVHKLQRPGLLLAGGNVYVGIGSLQDKPPFNGLLFAFNAATLAQQAVWLPDPTGADGGIWMGGAAPSVDENGNIYVSVGNGTFDGITNYGESVVKLSQNLQVLDYFAPYNYAAYDATDWDMGSSGVMVVPYQNGPFPHELITCGKTPSIYVLNRDNLGQVGTTSDNVIQELNGQVGVPSPGSTAVRPCQAPPAMWGQNVYFGGMNDVLKMFTLNPNTGMLSSTPVSQDSLVYGYPGADPVVSSNGATNGIVWSLDTKTQTLRAVDATNVANVFYSSPTLNPGGVFNWAVATVANGHVYVGGKTTVFAFGLTH